MTEIDLREQGIRMPGERDEAQPSDHTLVECAQADPAQFAALYDRYLDDISTWTEVSEGRIYFSTVDGDLVSIPLPNE